jgi:hypothetical protein
MFDVFTKGDTAQFDTIFKFLSHTSQHGCNGGNSGTYYYVPPLPRDLVDLKSRIIAAVKNIDAPMLTRV